MDIRIADNILSPPHHQCIYICTYIKSFELTISFIIDDTAVWLHYTLFVIKQLVR